MFDLHNYHNNNNSYKNIYAVFKFMCIYYDYFGKYLQYICTILIKNGNFNECRYQEWMWLTA